MFDKVYFLFIWCFQIIAESLPISSSGHLKLIENFKQNKFLDCYSKSQSYYLNHIPTLFVLLPFLIPYWFSLNFQELKSLFILILIADFFTAIIYFAIKKILKFIDLPLYLGFIFTAIILFLFYIFRFEYQNDINITKAIIIGCAQGLARLPAVSRLAITIFTSCYLGINPVKSLYFSLTIFFPLIVAASIKALIKTKNLVFFSKYNILIILLTLISILISYNLLKVIELMLKNYIFWLWSIYMLIPIFLAFKQNLKIRECEK